MKKYLILFYLLFVGCDVEVTESTVYGCCDTEAWNYSSDVTAHADSLCVYNFNIINPDNQALWPVGSVQTINWTGGDSNYEINLYLIDVNTNATSGIIQSGFENLGTYQWNVSCFDCLDGPKTIYIEQDVDLDGTIDLFNQSGEFTIN